MADNFRTRCLLWDKPLLEARKRAEDARLQTGARLHFLKNLRNQTENGYTSVTHKVTTATHGKSIH
jgi:hypothetical protein